MNLTPWQMHELLTMPIVGRNAYEDEILFYDQENNDLIIKSIQKIECDEKTREMKILLKRQKENTYASNPSAEAIDLILTKMMNDVTETITFDIEVISAEIAEIDSNQRNLKIYLAPVA